MEPAEVGIGDDRAERVVDAGHSGLRQSGPASGRLLWLRVIRPFDPRPCVWRRHERGKCWRLSLGLRRPKPTEGVECGADVRMARTLPHCHDGEVLLQSGVQCLEAAREKGRHRWMIPRVQPVVEFAQHPRIPGLPVANHRRRARRGETQDGHDLLAEFGASDASRVLRYGGSVDFVVFHRLMEMGDYTFQERRVPAPGMGAERRDVCKELRIGRALMQLSPAFRSEPIGECPQLPLPLPPKIGGGIRHPGCSAECGHEVHLLPGKSGRGLAFGGLRRRRIRGRAVVPGDLGVRGLFDHAAGELAPGRMWVQAKRRILAEGRGVDAMARGSRAAAAAEAECLLDALAEPRHEAALAARGGIGVGSVRGIGAAVAGRLRDVRLGTIRRRLRHVRHACTLGVVVAAYQRCRRRLTHRAAEVGQRAPRREGRPGLARTASAL